MGELKPRSYRIDDETAEKIKTICTEMGEGQQVAFSRLIEAYEMQKKKVSLGDDKEQVEQFEAYISILTRMFMETVETKHNMKETVRNMLQCLHQKMRLYRICRKRIWQWLQKWRTLIKEPANCKKKTRPFMMR